MTTTFNGVNGYYSQAEQLISINSGNQKPLGTSGPTQRPFSASSPFNIPTPGGTVWYDHAVLHNYQGGDRPNDTRLHWYVLRPFGVVYGTDSDPIWKFQMPDYVAPAWNRNRPAKVLEVRAPANLVAGDPTDSVTFVVNGTTYYEVWNSVVDQTNRTVTCLNLPGWATGDILTGPGAGTISNNDGTRAANFSWAAGLITGRDLTNGVIDHALAIALTGPMLAGNVATTDYRAPATGIDNGGATGPIKMGSKIGIPSGVAQPAGLTTLGIMVFNALKTYGAYVGDFVGGSWPVFYADKATTTEAQMEPLFAWFYQPGGNDAGSADMEKITPLLRVADYQP